MAAPPRVLIAGLFHETHTFLEESTRLADFHRRRKAELLACEGDGSPLGEVLAAARRYGWQVVPALDWRASPSGIVDDDVAETFWHELRALIETAVEEGLDGIYLVLHGAMATPRLVDVEGELLRRLRSLPGLNDLPIYGVFDLHANFTAAMAQHSDGLVAYRENPHADAAEAAARGAALLDEALRSGQRHRTFWRHAGIVWPPTGTGTAQSPMADLEALARRLELEHGLAAVNVIAGFAFADTPDTGVSFSVVANDAERAESALNQLCQLAWDLRDQGIRLDEPCEAVLARLASLGRGPIVIAEPSDNIGGGAPGDGTGLLRALLEHDVSNALICINDAPAVEALESLRPGERRTLPLGGRSSRFDAGPVTLDVELVSRGAGRFTLEDRHSHLASLYGDTFDMGPCAVVRHRGITVLLTSIKTPPFDLGQWRSQGLIPESFTVIGVKAAVAHRKAYEPIAAHLLSVDTPGPCPSDVTKLPYKNLRRPVFPLDK
jgi:microcystin degradation protein MlrC